MKNTFELEHVGINTDNAGEAEQLALLLCKLFNLEPRHGQKSEFAGNYFECMKSPFLGKNGHIAMRTPDLKAAMDELLDDPVKNYLKQIGQIPLLSAEQEVDLSKRIHAGAEAAHILQADRQKYGATEYIKKNSARFSFEEDENSRSYTEDIDEEGSEKPSEDAEEKAAEEEAMEAVENGPLSE